MQSSWCTQKPLADWPGWPKLSTPWIQSSTLFIGYLWCQGANRAGEGRRYSKAPSSKHKTPVLLSLCHRAASLERSCIEEASMVLTTYLGFSFPFSTVLYSAGCFGATHDAGRSPDQVSRTCVPQPAYRACTRNLALEQWGVSTPPRRSCFLLILLLLFRRLRTRLRFVAFFLWDLIRKEEKWIWMVINSSVSTLLLSRAVSGSRTGTHTVTPLGGPLIASRATLNQRQCVSVWLMDVTNNLCIFIKGSFSIFDVLLKDAVSTVKELHRCFDWRKMGFELSWLQQKAWRHNCPVH